MPEFVVCIGDTTQVVLQVSVTSETESSGNITLQLHIPNENPEISIAGGDFDGYGQATIHHAGKKSSFALIAFISAATSADTGQLIPIQVSAVEIGEEYCITSDSTRSNINLFTINCAETECGCAELTGSLNIHGNVYLSDLINQDLIGTSNSSPLSCISITGVFYIDVLNFEIDKAEIKLSPASSIVVTNTSSLTITNSHIHGCDKLWLGIFKWHRGYLIIDNNVIEDGTYSINPVPLPFEPDFYPVVKIQSNKFKKNFISLYQSSNHGRSYYKEFTNNEFTCENMSLLPSAIHINFSTQPKTKSYAAVFMSGTFNTILIGPYNYPGLNRFHHLQNGIVGIDADIKVSHSIFNNIPINNEYSDLPNLSSGHGILILRGSLQQRGLGIASSASSTFQDVKTAIKIFRPTGSTSITQNKMAGINTGVSFNALYAIPSLSITENYIYCSDLGIDLIDPYRASTYDISDNFIDVDGPLSGGSFGLSKGIGIRANNTKVDFPDIIGKINKNILNIRDNNYGIYVNATYKIEMIKNEIYLLHSGARTGISFVGSGQGTLNCNLVDGVSTSYQQGRNIAFDINNSTGAKYTCNNATNTGIGFRFSGICGASIFNPMLQTDFRGNTMNTQTRGLWMQPDAIFGSMTNDNEMTHRGNQWVENFSEHRAIHEGAVSQIFYSKFKVHTDNLPYYPRSNNPGSPAPATPNAPGVTWFAVNNDGNPYPCSEQDCETTIQIIDSLPTQISDLGLGIAADTLTFTSAYDESMKWSLKRHLYRTLEDYPDLQNQDEALGDFYFAESTSSIGQFTTIDRLIALSNHWDSLSIQSLYTWEDAIQVRWDSIYAVQFQIQEDTSFSESTEDEGILRMYLTEIDSFRQLQNALNLEWQAANLPLIDSASVLNTGVTPTLDIEVNEKTVNQVYLDKIARGDLNLSESETNAILDIAYQCPTLGGNAIFRARSILATIGWSEYYFNDDSLCLVGIQRQDITQNRLNIGAKNLRVFPNPVREKITIQTIGQPESTTAEIIISDILGKKWDHYSPLLSSNPEGIYEIPVTSLPEGVYFLQLFLDRKLFGKEKFVVTK